MPARTSRLTRDQLLEETLAAPRRSLLGLEDTRVIEREGWWQVITPSLRQGGLNEVGFASLDEDEADAVIDATIAGYRELGLRFRWTVVPGSRPADLADRLARRGLTATESRAMWRRTAAAGKPPVPGGIRVEAIGTQGVDAFTAVMAEGWELDPAPVDALHRTMLADPDRRFALFVARHGGESAAVASTLYLARSAYLMGAVVLPRFRGRGLYRALVTARLAEAARRGLAIATTQARAETSAPLLERLGFATICRFPVFST